MKKFLIHCLLFFLITVVFFELTAILVMNRRSPFRDKISWYQVRRKVMNSRGRIPGDTIYLGDSVGRQIFQGKNKQNLSSNGAVLMAGHYILCRNAVERNPNIKKIVLVLVPTSLGQEFERDQTYNNFIKPFYYLYNFSHFTPLLFSKLNRKPLSYLCFLNIVKILPVDDIDFSIEGREEQINRISDIGLEYLKKLDSFCRENELQLVLVSAPVSTTNRRHSGNWRAMKKQIRDEGLEDLFRVYFKRQIVLPSRYLMDRSHMKQKYIEANRDKILEHILTGCGYTHKDEDGAEPAE